MVMRKPRERKTFMIYTVHYEPQSQRQQFEPREQQGNNLWQMHLRLSFHFHLDLGARLRRARHTPVARVTTIFAAFMGALALALSPYWTQAHSVQTPPMLDALFSLAEHLVLAGALLGVGTVLIGGLPLAVSAWRTSPRSRILFLVPILASLPTIACSLLSAFIMLLSNQPPPFFPTLPVLLFSGGTVVSTIAINRTIRQARIADRWLRLANHLSRLVVVGMVLMLIGTVLWGFVLALAVPGGVAMLIPRLPLPCGMFLAVMVALWASFWRVQPPVSQPRPHDASPAAGDSGDSSGEPQGYRG
jgi:hypothetical protein